MSAGAQISWDEQQSSAAPQVSWDQEEKPEKKSFLSRAYQGVRDWMPEGIARRGLEKGAEWAGRKQQESYDADLKKAATTGEQRLMSAYSPGTGYGMMSDAMHYLAGSVQPKPKEAAIMAGGALLPEIVGPALIGHGLYSGAKAIPDAVKGNPEAAEKALLGGSEAASGGALTTGALSPSAPRTFTRNAMSAVNRTLIKAEPPNAVVPAAHKALTQAIQPGVNIPRAQESIGIAGPRMQQVRQASGMEVKNTQDALNLVRASKDVVHRAIEDRLGPVAALQPSTEPVADAMEKSISGRTERQFPSEAEAIRRRADTYRGNLSLREIENSIQDANNGLRNFYKQTGPTDSPTSAHMDATLAEVKALRNLLDEKVESLSGAGVKPLKREYGALRDVERATAKQHAIATRTKEGGLWEGLAYLHAAGDLLSGNALGAAKAGGALTVGRMLKTLRDPNFLLQQSFHGPKAFEAAEPIAPHAGPPAPKGLLPKPATEAGFTQEDTSGPVRGGRYTTPAAQLTEGAPLSAKFIREIPKASPTGKLKGLLPSGEMPPTNIPPMVDERFATEATRPPENPAVLGPGGKGGTIGGRKLLPGGSTQEPTFNKAAVKAAKPYVASEKAATMSAPAKDYGPEFNAQQAQEEINRNQAILRNPAATAEDRTVAESRLRDAKEMSQTAAPTFNDAALKAVKEPEPVETEIKGITAKAAKPAAKREVAPPIEQRFSRDEIADAEGLIAQEVGMMQSADRPGRYYDENEMGDYNPQKEQSSARGVTAGGRWRGVSSMRDSMPFLKEHPDWSPAQLEKALRNKDSAFYKKAMEAAVQFVRRGKDVEAEERAAIQEEPPLEKEPEGVFPGMGEHVREQEAGAARVKAEDLAREITTPRSIESAAGEMETKSPLFRGTEASPQREIFSQAAVKAAKKSTAGNRPSELGEVQHLLSGKGLGLHIDKYPSGKYGYVGSIPGDIGFVTEKGETPTAEQLKEIKQSSNPGMVMKHYGIKHRIFDTESEAREFAKARGYEAR